MNTLAATIDGWCALDDAGAAWRAAAPCVEGREVLVPLCRAHAEDERLMATLAAWRNRHVRAFPSRFEATAASTRRWLENNVLPGDRAVLLVAPADANGDLSRAIGHVGVCGYRDAARTGSVELENIVRGDDGRQAGAMSRAMQALIALCERHGARMQELRVFDDNARAIAFYERLGFAAGERTPMRRSSTPGDDSVAPRAAGDDAPGDEHLLHMVRMQQTGAQAT